VYDEKITLVIEVLNMMPKIEIPVNQSIIRKLPLTETNFVPNEEVQVCHSDVLILI